MSAHQPQTAASAWLAFHSPAELPPLSRLIVTFGLTLARWERRRTSRRALSRLDAHLLQDIGLNTEGRDRECRKSFWEY